MRHALAVCLLLVGVFALTSPALGAGGDYQMDGGTPAEQAQVRMALQASAFDWSLVPGVVRIHIVRGLARGSYSTLGQTWLDANVLDTGRFSWGVVQMEYAQQVQQMLVPPALRAELISALGAKQWCYDDPTLPPGDNACERFAATLAWAYWPSGYNSMQPSGSGDWSGAMPADAFRALLTRAIGAPDALKARRARSASYARSRPPVRRR